MNAHLLNRVHSAMSVHENSMATQQKDIVSSIGTDGLKPSWPFHTYIQPAQPAGRRTARTQKGVLMLNAYASFAEAARSTKAQACLYVRQHTVCSRQLIWFSLLNPHTQKRLSRDGEFTSTPLRCEMTSTCRWRPTL